MLSQTYSQIESALAAATPEAASRQFFRTLEKLGATYLQTRLYHRPPGPLSSQAHWDAGGLVTRIAPDGWVGSDAFNYICFENNPLLGAIRESRTRYRFSDFAPHGAIAFGQYWDALGEARIGEALCATSYGPRRAIASLHLGFERRDFDPDEARTIQMAGLMLTERLMEFVAPAAKEPALTPRERDCLSFVAEGHTDRQIAALMGISEPTVRFHLENGRRKLGAVNRAHAVARFAARGLM